jgi:hypothetical protein
MDVSERIAASLPDAIEHVEKDGPIAELWLMARAYSRLRHRTSPTRHPEQRRRYENLKSHCIRLAVTRAPEAFLVFADPGNQHLLIIYHRDERTLLHIPLALWGDGAAHRGLATAQSSPSLWNHDPESLRSFGAEGCTA